MSACRNDPKERKTESELGARVRSSGENGLDLKAEPKKALQRDLGEVICIYARIGARS
jgi:hypothetical protein